ncbi:MAG: aminoacetone oxidase family FAD-binding enzyme [Firmicutes bacterium]|nr:aminoacetone oxidase family FAD-binding enzyme [Bacillota bacterium]
MDKKYDIVIVGAGPAGLTAAITSKRVNPNAKVALLEKKDVPGKKLSASGNGRGNLSNKNCDSLDDVLHFFSEMGIAVRMDEEGRIYPYSEEAKAVSDTLTKRAKRLGVELFTECEVSNVEADPKGGFHIFILSKQELHAEKVLIATGGKSFANYGSSGDGFGFARNLGHKITPLVPALTAIEVAESLKELKGVRVKGEASLFNGGQLIFKEAGEIQFKEDSLSGICVMNMSSALPVGEKGRSRDSLATCRIALNFVPEFSSADLIGFLKSKQEAAEATAFDMIETMVKKPLALAVLKMAGIQADAQAKDLTLTQLLAIANHLRGFSLIPTGRKGWKEAQVTKGGVSLDELDLETMESKLMNGLYFAGEVTDYDGPCGGFNLNNAWLQGLRAGKDMASHV